MPKPRGGGGPDLQAPMAAAVVMPSVLRPSLAAALASVFAQDLEGPIQVLIGLDLAPDTARRELAARLAELDATCVARPPHCVVQVFYPGYSTSVRHGGLHPARDGGVLRAVLTYLANAPYVAYLDDDNWWASEHLRLLRDGLVAGADWAYALRWFVHPLSRRPICVDRWESVGPGQGVFKDRMGGFVDPNCLMINKLRCAAAVPFWNVPLEGDAKAMSADRHVFAVLSKHFRPAAVDRPTVYYQLDPEDAMHPLRRQLIGPAYDEAA